MSVLIVLLIVAILSGGLVYADSFLNSVVAIPLHAEEYMNTLLETNGFTELFTIFFGVGINLIIIKFLKKGFEVYILWTDGDANSDPLILLTNFIKALAIAVSFSTMYQWLIVLIEELIDKVLSAIGVGMDANFSNIISSMANLDIFVAIASLIYFIYFFRLYIQFLSRGIELLILRIGLPLACGGIMDANKGVFKTYIQKFLQASITVMLQVVLVKMGAALFINHHVFWGIAALKMAIQTPRMLQEFLVTSGGGGGMGGIYQSVRLVQVAKNAFRR